jgi:hypothetical protein
MSDSIFKGHDFNDGDSLILSSIAHPITAAQKLAAALQNNVGVASGVANQYDNPTPYYAPSEQEQLNAAMNLAGSAELGSAPFAPESSGGTVGTFIGRHAKNWDNATEDAFLKGEQAGLDERSLWSDHGVFRGADTELRQEIPDTGAIYVGSSEGPYNNNAKSVFPHDELYSNYPEFKNYRMREGNYRGGSFNDGEELSVPTISIGTIGGNTEAKSTALHELQHAVQGNEGFARGGNPDAILKSWNAQIGDEILNVWDKMEAIPEYQRRTSPEYAALKSQEKELKMAKAKMLPEAYTSYHNLAGEAESRATQKRAGMSAIERRNVFPYDSYDVPRDELIISDGITQPSMPSLKKLLNAMK